MTTTLVLACVVLAAAVVSAERCSTSDECQLVSCATGSNVICERQECTCSDVQKRCVSQRDCYSTQRCSNSLAKWHCIDNVCRCAQI